MAKLTLQQTLDKSLKTAKQYIDAELAKKADSSHGTHVTWSTTTPKANGTASVGSETKVARGDHVHPLQTTVSGNAGTATKLKTTRAITIGNKSNNFDGSAAITYTLADIGAVSQTDFDAFNIGGRNYITDSKKETSTTSTYQTRTLSADAKTDLAGKVVTASFDLKGTTAGGDIYVYFRSSSGSITPVSQTIGACTTEYKRYTITFTAPSDLSTAATFGFHTTSAVGTAYIKNVKVELGNRASSWCYAIEDYALASHGTHVTYATSAPKANGTAAVGTVNRVAREDHVHPLQTTVSGNAGTATKLKTARAITIGNKSNNFDGSAAITYSLADIGALPAVGGTATGNITIKQTAARFVANNNTNSMWMGLNADGTKMGLYDEVNGAYLIEKNTSTKAVTLNGNASTATKVNSNLVVKLNGGSTEGTNLFTFNGSAAKTINITPSAIGASPANNHNHKYFEGGGTSGTSGYVAFAQLKITGAYTNRPIEFKLICRGKATSCTVNIQFANVNGTDPGLASLKYWGTDYGIFAHKTDTSTWLLYHTKSESYDNVTVVNCNYGTQSITITYPGTFITARPSSNTTNATLGGYVGNANTVGGYSVWVGTQAQYNALSSKSSTTIYYITG